MNATYLRRIYLKLAGVVTLVVLLALLANAALTQRTFEQALAPEVAKKAMSVGASIRALVLKAAENGIGFAELYGVEQRFADVKNEAPEVAYLALTDASGQVLYQHARAPEGAERYFSSPAALRLLAAPEGNAPPMRLGNQYMVSLPIVGQAGPLGLLHLGVDARFVNELVLDMLFDVLVVLVVSLFFTLELLHFMAGARLDASLKALGEAFERGASGNFLTRRDRRNELAFGGLLRLMDATLERVNGAYAALGRAVDAGRRVPAHERQPGLAKAQAGLQALGERYRFGTEPPSNRLEEGDLAKIRAPLFMFILAEELTRPFLPGYVKELLVPVSWISPQMMVGLPIALFMLIVAIGQPFFGVYCERVGHRRTMMLGAGIAAAGFVASAMAHNVLDLLLWRSLCALGYGLVFVAGQAFVLDHATSANRARSFALFVGAIMAATVCGPSIGGILADNVGTRVSFVVAAVLAAASMMVIRLLPDSREVPSNRGPARLPRLVDIAALATNRRFMTVTGLAAMPAKILLTGLCFYLVPLYVLSIGDSQAMAGRIVMIYGVVMVVMAPVTAALASSRDRMNWLVGGGLVLSGLGGTLMLAGQDVGWVFAAVILVGLGQSLSISAQSALVTENCEAEIERLGDGTVYGVYRLLERLGNALGPLIAAALVSSIGYRHSFVAIGAGVLLCGLVFLVATRRSPQPQLVPA